MGGPRGGHLSIAGQGYLPRALGFDTWCVVDAFTGGNDMRAIAWFLTATLLAMLAGGCASMEPTTKQRQTASVLSYLFPGSEQAPPIPNQVAEIKVPFRIRLPFVPNNPSSAFPPPP